MILAEDAISAILNLLLLGFIPFLLYFAYHRWRQKRTIREVAQLAGLQVGEARYIAYAAAIALVAVAALILWPPPVESFIREGSPQKAFAGLGLGGQAIVLALLYGVVKTGFPEELLFRGLIAGSLSCRLPPIWANLLQAVIFLLPHLLVLRIMPEMWTMLPLIFVGALVMGWLRMKSGSMLGPALVHAALNVTICLSVAGRTGA